MSDQEKVRSEVKDAYAQAVSEPRGEGCCCGGSTTPKGVLALLAGYSAEELKSIPKDAAVNSFGCGNPLAMSEIGEGETVLDLGSGAGLDILLAARIVGPTGKAIGVDMTDEMIERARANAEAAGLDNVDVRKGIIEELPVESNTVDWVISNCVINLSPEKERVFREIARVLKPGGKMLVSDIVLDEAPDWIRTVPRLYSSCIAGAIPEEAYKAGLAGAGLSEVSARARQDYTPASILALIGTEESTGCCGGDPLPKETIEKLLNDQPIKAASVSFFARKPE